MKKNFYKDYYNKYASVYQERFDCGEMPFHEKVQIPLFKGLIRHRNYNHALDIGCGNGIYSKIISNYSRKVTAIDISNSMLKIAKKINLSYNIEYKCSDIRDFDPGRRFDLIFAGFMPSYFEDMSVLFNSIDRLLDRNGVFIASMLHPARMALRIAEENGKLGNSGVELLRNNIYYSDFLSLNEKLPLHAHYDGAFEDMARKHEFIIEEDYSPAISESNNLNPNLNPSIKIFRLYRASYFSICGSFEALRREEKIKDRTGNELAQNEN